MSITTTTIVRPLQKTLTCTTSAAHVMLRVYRTPATIMTQVKHLAFWDINIIQIIFVIVSMLYYNMDTITALRLRLDWKKTVSFSRSSPFARVRVHLPFVPDVVHDADADELVRRTRCNTRAGTDHNTWTAFSRTSSHDRQYYYVIASTVRETWTASSWVERRLVRLVVADRNFRAERVRQSRVHRRCNSSEPGRE